MRKLCLLLLLQVATLALLAQQNEDAQPHEPLNPQKDKKEFQGFTIRLKPAPGNTYLFDILRRGTPAGAPLHHNPVTMLPQGFNSKADAYKVAEWMIKKQKKTGHIPPVLPPHIAKTLNISVEKLYNQNKPARL